MSEFPPCDHWNSCEALCLKCINLQLWLSYETEVSIPLKVPGDGIKRDQDMMDQILPLWVSFILSAAISPSKQALHLPHQ